MALEIERRFLVRGSEWRRHILWEARLEQGYLVATADGLTVRVRRSSGAEPGAWLTLKARAPQGAGSAGQRLQGLGPEGLVRQEFEYPIPPGDAGALLALAPQQLSKWRYGLDLPGATGCWMCLKGKMLRSWWPSWSLSWPPSPRRWCLARGCRWSGRPGASWSSPDAMSSATRPWPAVPWLAGRRPSAGPCWRLQDKNDNRLKTLGVTGFSDNQGTLGSASRQAVCRRWLRGSSN